MITHKSPNSRIESHIAFNMVSDETQGFNIPTSAFTFVLERPVTPIRNSFTPVPASPHNLTHRRIRSRARSLDGRPKAALALAPTGSPPTTTTLQRAPSPGLGHVQDSPKAEDIGLIVEKNVFHSGMAAKAIEMIKDCKALGIGQGAELPRVSINSNISTRASTECCLVASRRRALQRKIKFTRKLDWSTSAIHDSSRMQIPN